VVASGLAGLICADHDVEAQELESLLEKTPIAPCAFPPDVLILDAPPGGGNVIPRLQSAYPGIPVIGWVRAAGSEPSLNALEMGAVGILQDHSSSRDILACVASVLDGSIWAPPWIAQALISSRQCKLTRREGQLIKLVSQGLCNKEIASALTISVGTVKVYISRLFDKLDVSDRYELALLVLRQGGSGQARLRGQPVSPTKEECPRFGIRSKNFHKAPERRKCDLGGSRLAS
jgi:DNA-binding NarL/FixJ family response regulator